jgi:hypothetical protein
MRILDRKLLEALVALGAVKLLLTLRLSRD